jgi:hypothetical protein
MGVCDGGYKRTTQASKNSPPTVNERQSAVEQSKRENCFDRSRMRNHAGACLGIISLEVWILRSIGIKKARTQHRNSPAADSGEIQLGAQDLPRMRKTPGRHLHSLRRLGQHPQCRVIGARSRHYGRDLDECMDLERHEARQSRRPDRKSWQVARFAVTVAFIISSHLEHSWSCDRFAARVKC